MKKKVMLLILMVFINLLIAQNGFMKKPKIDQRIIPANNFHNPPLVLGESRYDYMLGGYESNSLKVLEDGKVYAVFHAQADGDVNRRNTFSEIRNGIIHNSFYINQTDMWEGFPGLAVDENTGNPLVSWHTNMNESNSFEVVFSYAEIQSGEIPEIWNDPQIIIDEDTESQFEDDYFLWSTIYIGQSPQANLKRIYITAKNATSHNNTSMSCLNPLLAFADYNPNDFSNLNNLEWNYITIDLFDSWDSAGVPNRISSSFAVSEIDGRVAYFGHNGFNETFVVYNNNYGEGEWSSSIIEYSIPVENPIDQNGNSTFADDSGNALELAWEREQDTNFNAIFNDSGNKIFSMGTLGLQNANGVKNWSKLIFPKIFSFDFETEEFSILDLDITGANPNDNIPMKPWDLDEDGEVDGYNADGTVQMEYGWPIYFHNVDDAARDNQFYLTKGENGRFAALWFDGLKNKQDMEDDDNGIWHRVAEMAISISDNNGENWKETVRLSSVGNDEFFQINPCYATLGDKITDLGNGYGEIHFMFYDDTNFGCDLGTMNQGAFLGYQIYASLEVDFDSQLGLFCGTVFSDDGYIGGAEIVEQNVGILGSTNCDGEFSFYLEPGDYTITFNAWGHEESIVDIVIIEDEETVLDIEMEMLDSPETEITPAFALENNYPNPFNPSGDGRCPTTTINFTINQLENEENVEINIFNIKGQEVKTLVNEKLGYGKHQVIWNGTDWNNLKVGSGVYFYRLKVGDFVQTKRMLLLK